MFRIQSGAEQSAERPVENKRAHRCLGSLVAGRVVPPFENAAKKEIHLVEVLAVLELSQERSRASHVGADVVVWSPRALFTGRLQRRVRPRALRN
jgi:hypothetical protein